MAWTNPVKRININGELKPVNGNVRKIEAKSSGDKDFGGMLRDFLFVKIRRGDLWLRGDLDRGQVYEG